jgi:hypothetical protein
MRLLVISLLLLFIGSPAAEALEGRLKRHGSTDIVIVWRDADAHSEGLSLINAGVHQSDPALLYSLVACLAAVGTKIVVTGAGFFTYDILVVEGKNAGCRGNIAMEHFDEVAWRSSSPAEARG